MLERARAPELIEAKVGDANVQLVGEHHVGALEVQMEDGLRRVRVQEVHAERNLSSERIKGHVLEPIHVS